MIPERSPPIRVAKRPAKPTRSLTDRHFQCHLRSATDFRIDLQTAPKRTRSSLHACQAMTTHPNRAAVLSGLRRVESFAIITDRHHQPWSNNAERKFSGARIRMLAEIGHTFFENQIDF